MSTLNGQWIEVFAAGNYGARGKFTTADLDEVVRTYDPRYHEAPAVIGHPENDAPAYGWVESVKRDGNTLSVKLRQVQPEFEDAVRSGKFKKRSIALYRDLKDGAKWYLRHVGFLGAEPPEVKGLADVKLCEFRDGNYQAIEFSNQEEEMDPNEIKKSFLDGLKEFFSEWTPKWAKQTGEPQGDVEAKIAKAIEGASAKFSEELKARDKQITDLTTQLGEAKKLQGTATTVALAEGAITKLKEDRKWIPAFSEMGVPQIFSELAKSEVKLTFGEGDKKKEKTLVQVFSEFLSGLPEIVPIGEITKAANTAKKGGKVLRFNEASRVELDQDSVAFSEAVQKRADEKKIPFGDAMKQLREEGWAPTKQGGSAAGAV